MPSVFRHPSEPDDSTTTTVFAAYGKGLTFEIDDNKGTEFRDITDGMSNTIAIVEAKRDIPWTKPEDILIDVEADRLPEFGILPDVFAVGLGDGSPRFISKTIDQTVLKKLFTRSGGEVVGQF